MRRKGFAPERSTDKEVVQAVLEVAAAQESKCKLKLALCSHVYHWLVLAFRNLWRRKKKMRRGPILP